MPHYTPKAKSSIDRASTTGNQPTVMAIKAALDNLDNKETK